MCAESSMSVPMNCFLSVEVYFPSTMLLFRTIATMHKLIFSVFLECGYKPLKHFEIANILIQTNKSDAYL